MEKETRFTRVRPKAPREHPELGTSIRDQRKALGISQARLAELMREAGRTNWHQNTVSRIEKGSQSVVTVGDLRALKNILGPLEGDPFSGAIGKAFAEFSVENKLTGARTAAQEAREAIERLEGILDEFEALITHGDEDCDDSASYSSVWGRGSLEEAGRLPSRS